MMVAASVCVASGFLAAFLWSVNDGQYEDKEGASMRILNED
jgi:cbb3-type cytochrome oxidase maturation protein